MLGFFVEQAYQRLIRGDTPTGNKSSRPTAYGTRFVSSIATTGTTGRADGACQ